MGEWLSVIIPVYNRENLVERTLDSVFSQTHRPLQLVVVDNASSDGTLTKLQLWKKEHESEDFQVIIAEEHRRGASFARNKGFSLATSETVLFFDSDDEMHPILAERAISAFKSNPDIEMVIWRVEEMNDKGERNERRFINKNLLKRHLYNGMLCTVAYAVKRDFFSRSGGWNTELTGWDDWELGLRLLLMKPRIKMIDDTLVTIHPQQVSITGVDFKSKHGVWERAIEAMERESRKEPEPLHSRLMNMLTYRRVNLAALYKMERADDLATALLKKSLDNPSLPRWRKMLLRLFYHYTSRGGRCAYLLWPE